MWNQLYIFPPAAQETMKDRYKESFEDNATPAVLEKGSKREQWHGDRRSLTIIVVNPFASSQRSDERYRMDSGNDGEVSWDDRE
jgi:hypothetical protein